MEHSFTTHGAKLVELLKLKADKPEVELDFQQTMSDLTFETICDIAFGVDPGSLEAGLAQNRKVDFLVRFDRAQQNSALRFLLPTPIWKLMRFLNIGTERTLRNDCKELHRYVLDIVHKRKSMLKASEQSPTQENDRNDLLSLYIHMGKTHKLNYMLEDNYLLDTILNFMVAGRDTTSCTLTNVFKLMTPQVESQMLEEFDRVVGRGNPVSWEHVRDLRYCGAVFNEVLRLYPPVGADIRLCGEDDILPSGIRLFKGQEVGILNVCIGRDHHLWDEPDEFIPERWLEEQDGVKKPTRRPDEYVFPVFWGGPRLCLGKDMGEYSVIVVL